MKWSLRPQGLKALMMFIVALTINLVTIRVFAHHILQTQCVLGTEYGLWG